MTREEALAGHRKLWNEIADMIERGEKYDTAIGYKIAALIRINEVLVLKNRCYLCEYAVCCKNCPIEWYSEDCADAKYEDFIISVSRANYTQAAILARTIANLPERVVE